MKKLDQFDLQFRFSGSERVMPVEVFVERGSTIVVLDCSCCEEMITSRLPGGVLIPIASSLKDFFEEREMRNIKVSMTGTSMMREYSGVLDTSQVPEMKSVLENSISKFSKIRSS